MVPWRRLRALGAADRRLLAETGLLFLLARIGLWIVPFSVLRRVLDGSRPPRRLPCPEFPERVAWAVAAVARRLPGMTCLVQSLAAHALLQRRGCCPALHIGVRRGVRGRGSGAAEFLDAHAWVGCDGRVVAGEIDDLVEYRVLTPVEPAASSSASVPP
jgi:hypothetical protein